MYSIYKVEQNDTLNSIANKFGVSTESLQRWNGMSNMTTVFPGSYLLVPINMPAENESGKYNIYIVKSGDNVYQIAKSFGVPYEDVLKINGLNENDYIYPNQQILIPKQNTNMYMTTGNETVQSLYEKYQNNWSDFLKNNQLLYIAADQMIQDN